MNLQENILRIKEVMGLLKEYSEEQIDIKNTNANNFIYISSISQVPKVGITINDESSKLSWDNLVVVRASDELPSINQNYLVLHTSRALKTLGFSDDFLNNLKERWKNEYSQNETWEDFEKRYLKAVENRWTKHFTLNHVVADNMGGAWTDVGMIYLMPAQPMVNINGKPTSLYAIDTWYSKSVVLPPNTVVLYTDKSQGKLEKFGINFNVDVKNKKLKYPVYLLKIDSLAQADEVIRAMGYTVIVGGTHYSNEPKFDEKLRTFSKTAKSPTMGIHFNTLFSELEKGGGDFYTVLDHMKWLVENHDEETINHWYNSNRRIIKAWMENIIEKVIMRMTEEGWEELFKVLQVIKDKINDYPQIKNFRKDVLKSIKNAKAELPQGLFSVIDILKKFPWKANNYESFEEFLYDVLPK